MNITTQEPDNDFVMVGHVPCKGYGCMDCIDGVTYLICPDCQENMIWGTDNYADDYAVCPKCGTELSMTD